MNEEIAHSGVWFLAVIFPVIVIAYYLLSRSEEKKVIVQFGQEYNAYQKRVPMFIPRFGQWKEFADSRKKCYSFNY